MDLRPRTTRVKLSPTPGYCIKSTALQDAICRVTQDTASGTDNGVANASANSIILGGPQSAPLGTLKVSRGIKIFVNICWDVNVPPPPEGNEEMIQKAMRGEEELDDETLLQGGGWFVPVVVSQPRQDLDKAGKPSLVFDCVYNSTLKSRVLKDPSFKSFLTELALQRIEAQHSLSLSRQVGTPNIPAKGKLQSRTVAIPLQLYSSDHPVRSDVEKPTPPSGGRKLIEEIEPSSSSSNKPNKIAVVSGGHSGITEDSLTGIGARPAPSKAPTKSILKPTKHSTSSSPSSSTRAPSTLLHPTTSSSSKSDSQKTQPPTSKHGNETQTPGFSWTKDGDRLKIEIQVPKLTHAHIPTSTLDIEPHRLILSLPPTYNLDLDLSLPDAQLTSLFSTSGSETIKEILMLKRQRKFDVEGATAEWRVQEGALIIFV